MAERNSPEQKFSPLIPSKTDILLSIPKSLIAPKIDLKLPDLAKANPENFSRILAQMAQSDTYSKNWKITSVQGSVQGEDLDGNVPFTLDIKNKPGNKTVIEISTGNNWIQLDTIDFPEASKDKKNMNVLEKTLDPKRSRILLTREGNDIKVAFVDMARFSSVSSDEKNKNNDTDNYNFLRAHGKLVTMENLAKYLGDRITVMKNITPKDISEILSKVNGYMEMHETKRKAEIDTNRTKERDKLNELKKGLPDVVTVHG